MQFNVNIDTISSRRSDRFYDRSGTPVLAAAHILNFGNNLNVRITLRMGVTAGYTLGCGHGRENTLSSPFLNHITMCLQANDYGATHDNSLLDQGAQTQEL